MQLVHASFSVRKNPECGFKDCRSSVKLMKVGPTKHFAPLYILRYCEACAHLFEGWDRSGKHFSPLWNSCEACTCQFQNQKGFRKHFSPLWRSYEAPVRVFLCQDGPWKQVLLRHVKVVHACLSVRGKLKAVFTTVEL